MVKTPTRSETEEGKKGPSRPVALGKVNLLLALLGLLALVGAYWVGLLPTFLPEALALLILTLSLVTVASRAWYARRGGLEYGLLRHPNRVALLAAPAGPDPLPTARDLARRRGARDGYPCTRAWRPRAGRYQRPGGDWHRLPRHPSGAYLHAASRPGRHRPAVGRRVGNARGGRSTLLSHHYSTSFVRDAVDFMRLHEEGRGYDGDPKRAESWYGFGEPVLAPADGTVVSVSDIRPDEPIGELGQTPSYGNHILLEIGNHRYAVMAHLKQGSARVSEGERVRLGQQIAAVGDSGDSLWPHLHIHVQEGPDLDHQARTIPVVLSDVVLIRGAKESTLAGADLRRGDHIRRIED